MRETLYISDNGKGIEPGICAKIFQRTYTTKPVGKGTGLGLAIAKQIIEEKHSGCLNVDSKVGHGTILKIALPIQ
ncbi:MAG: HAMP domain-containing sensor histidine kinase, partial [Cyanobacteria bacterium J06598_3]